MTRFFAVLLILAACMSAPAQTISGQEDVELGRSVWLEVEGLSASEWEAAVVNVFPSGRAADSPVHQPSAPPPQIQWFQPVQPQPIEYPTPLRNFLFGRTRLAPTGPPVPFRWEPGRWVPAPGWQREPGQWVPAQEVPR